MGEERASSTEHWAQMKCMKKVFCSMIGEFGGISKALCVCTRRLRAYIVGTKTNDDVFPLPSIPFVCSLFAGNRKYCLPFCSIHGLWFMQYVMCVWRVHTHFSLTKFIKSSKENIFFLFTFDVVKSTAVSICMQYWW